MTTRADLETYLLHQLEELSRDWDYSKEIGPQSLMFSELGFESLDAVVLGVAIQEHFGQVMPFAELYAELGREQNDLSIGELVDFVEKHLHPQRSSTAQKGSAE